MKMKMKIKTPSSEQKFSFQTGKQVAKDKLVASLKTKRDLLMSNHRCDDTFGLESLQILQYENMLLRLGGWL